MTTALLATCLAASAFLATPTADATPVPATNSADMLAAADSVFIGRVDASAIAPGTQHQVVTIRVERPLKSSHPLVPGAMLHLEIDGRVETDLAPGGRSLFVLRCVAPSNVPACGPVVAHLPGWPAIDTASASVPRRDAADLERAAAVELVAVAAAADTTLATSSSEGLLTADQAAETRLAALRALDTLPRAAVIPALAAAGTPSFAPARLALLTARARVGQYDGLPDLQSIMQRDDADLALPRQELARALWRNEHPPEDLVPVMTAWLQSRDAIVRESAAYVMRNIASTSVIRPLLRFGITDSSQEVRYYAATGLAAATHDPGQYVASSVYRAAEATYLAHWRARQAALEATR